MNIDSHCTFKIHEFAAFEGWYWEIAVPRESHPVERIKEFTLDDPGLGWPVVLRPTASIHPVRKGCHVYKGSIGDRLVADAVMSCITSKPHCEFLSLISKVHFFLTIHDARNEKERDKYE